MRFFPKAFSVHKIYLDSDGRKHGDVTRNEKEFKFVENSINLVDNYYPMDAIKEVIKNDNNIIFMIEYKNTKMNIKCRFKKIT